MSERVERGMEEMLVERLTVVEFSTGHIEQTRYRANTVAPWINGALTVYCGSCCKQVAEETSEIDARIRHLEHQLEHAHEELSAYRRAFAGLVPRAT